MNNYQIKSTKLFNRLLGDIQKEFRLSQADTKNAIYEIKFVMGELMDSGMVPEGFSDHELKNEPYKGYREFHILDDLLVVYFVIEKKKTIRMVSITSHDDLHIGKNR
jgi:mRNA interferase YafQ